MDLGSAAKNPAVRLALAGVLAAAVVIPLSRQKGGAPPGGEPQAALVAVTPVEEEAATGGMDMDHHAGACDLLREHNAVDALGGEGRLHRLGSPVKVAVVDGVLRGEVQKTLRLLNGRSDILFEEVAWDGAGPPPFDQGIIYRFGEALDAEGKPGCGETKDFTDLAVATVMLPEAPGDTCPDRQRIVLHETVHALGFAGHVTGEITTIMHHTDRRWPSLEDWEGDVDGALKHALEMLYANPDGLPLSVICGGM